MEHTGIQIHKLMEGEVSPPGTLPITEEEPIESYPESKAKDLWWISTSQREYL